MQTNEKIVSEIDDSLLVDKPTIMRVGIYEGEDGVTYGFIELEDFNGKITRIWLDGDGVEMAIEALVEVIPDVIE